MSKSPKHKSLRGFTLIELSIVLVVIGLIVGGVLVGQDLIAVSKRRAVITDWQQLNTAVLTFRTKYNGLPGDLANADDFFTGSTNGDGNKAIWGAGNSFGHPSPTYGLEACRFYYHLSQARLIKGEYNDCTPGLQLVDSDHAPALPFEPTSVSVVFSESSGGEPTGSHNILTDGRYNGSAYWSIRQPVAMHSAGSTAAFTTEEARWLDTKIDDGQARTGQFTLSRNAGALPADSDYCIDTGAADEYDASETRRFCNTRLRTNF